MKTTEFAAKLREIGERARYSTEPGRQVQEIADALADGMDPPADPDAPAPAETPQA